MEFAIISDIHDRMDRLEACLSLLAEREVKHVIVCGDFCSPFVVQRLGESGLEVHAVFGNNDGDRFLMSKKAEAFSNIHLYGEYIGDMDTLLEIDGVKIGVSHYPFYAKTMVKTGWYDAVFFGHTHTYFKQKFGKSLYMSPGEIAGIKETPGFVIYDTEYRSSERIELN